MASHRLAQILRLTGLLSDEDIDSMSEDEAWRWLRSNAPLLLENEDMPGSGNEH